MSILGDFPKLGFNADGYVVSFLMVSANNVKHTAVLGISKANDGTSTGMRTVSQLGNDIWAPASEHGVPISGTGGIIPMWFVRDAHSEGAADSIDVIRLNNPFGSEPADLDHFPIDVVEYVKPPNGPRQPGGGAFFFPGARFYHSSLRTVNGVTSLVAAHTVGVPVLPDKLASGVQWYEFTLVDGVLGTPLKAQEGIVNASPSTTDTYFPSIEISLDGTIGINFLQSGPTQFVTMYVGAHRPGDQPGTMTIEGSVRSSDANVTSQDALTNIRRIGDYSFLSVDPLNGTFWAVNEYVTGNTNPNWGTWIQNFDFKPRVTDVAVRNPNPLEPLHPAYRFNAVDAGGARVGSGRQLQTIPVGGANTVEVTFSTDVNINDGDLRMVGLRTGYVPTRDTFDYNSATRTATWKFKLPPNVPSNTYVLPPDQYVIHVEDAVTEVGTGVALDGEWTNPGRVYAVGGTTQFYAHPNLSKFPSGDGIPGGDFSFVVTILPGDLNLNNAVTFNLDVLAAFNSIGMFSGLAVWSQGDFNGTGNISFNGDVLPAFNIIGINLQQLDVLGDWDNDWDVENNDLTLIASADLSLIGDLNKDGAVTEADRTRLLDIAMGQLTSLMDIRLKVLG
jgi:hypothetical protein